MYLHNVAYHGTCSLGAWLPVVAKALKQLKACIGIIPCCWLLVNAPSHELAYPPAGRVSLYVDSQLLRQPAKVNVNGKSEECLYICHNVYIRYGVVWTWPASIYTSPYINMCEVANTLPRLYVYGKSAETLGPMCFTI
jgi:hypothetical protein